MPKGSKKSKGKGKAVAKSKKGRSGNPAKRAQQETGQVPAAEPAAFSADQLPEEFSKLLGD